MNSTKLSILSAVLFSLSCQAKTYLPVFTNHWYTHATFDSQDSCYADGYHYTNYGNGPDNVYAASVLSDLSTHKNCQWSKAFLKSQNTQRPADFDGTNAQWHTLSDQKNAVLSESWQRNCLNDKKFIIDSTSTTIWPNYACPSNTHYGLDNGVYSCTDAPLACSADIVGRDMIFNDPNKIFGHVGLTNGASGKTTVLEIMTDPSRIAENTLESFITKSKYWGEKYGLKGTAKLTSEQAAGIVKAGTDQKPFELEYTVDWRYHPSINGGPSLFRCDSFVYYCYQQGAQLKIFPTGFHFPETPPMMFNKFLSFRTSRYHENALPIISTPYPYTRIPDNNLAYQTRLTNLFANEDFDISSADYLTYQYIYDYDVTRTEKMQVLYDLMVKHQKDYYAFWYLMGVFSVLDPIEYTPQLIKLYQQQPSLKLKEHLLFRLDDLISLIHTDAKDRPAILAHNQANIALIKQLYQDVLQHETDPELLHTAIYMHSHIGTPEQAKNEVMAALQRAKANNIKLVFNVSGLDQLIFIHLNLAFMSNETQVRDLPDLLSATNPNANIMPFYVASKLDNTQPEIINDQVRPMLKDYLQQHQSEMRDHDYSHENDQQRLPNPNWLKAYATVMVQHDDEKIPYMFSYIRALNDPRLQAEYLKRQSWQVLDKLSAKDRVYYQTLFQQKLQDPQLSDVDRRLFKSGLSSIKKRVEDYHFGM